MVGGVFQMVVCRNMKPGLDLSGLGNKGGEAVLDRKRRRRAIGSGFLFTFCFLFVSVVVFVGVVDRS